MNKFLKILIPVFLFQTAAANDYQLEGIGEYRYGQNETEAEACAIAFEEAKRSALRKKFGEVAVQSRDSVCGDSVTEQTGNTCEIYERGFTAINSRGFISSFEPYEPEVRIEPGYKVCTVKTIFSIKKFDGEPDPTFEILDFRLSSGPLVRVSDAPRISLKTNRAAFHYIYSWAPDVDPQNYHLIYPNIVDPQNDASSYLEIPTVNRLKSYEIEVTLPKNQNTSYEFLFLLSSKIALQAPQLISQKNYQLWLFSLNRDEWTQKKYNYRVIKGDSL